MMFSKERQMFNIILEDGGVYNNVYIKCLKGFVRNKRDLKNALKWENGVKIITKTKDIWVKCYQIYEFEEMGNVNCITF